MSTNLEFDFSEKFKFIDLFAGIGGFHLALSQLGMQCVFASEFDEHARKTYLKNHKIDEKDFNRDIRSASYELIPEHDILCGGFPCQAFSHAGKREGLIDGAKSERGNLFYCILEILSKKRPRAFILENVRGLVNHDEGRTFQIIRHELESLNYSVHYKILKASEYGRPQHRPRIFIVGFNKDLVETQQAFQFPAPVPLKLNMSDVWEAECSREIGFTLRVGGKSSPIDDRRNWDGYLVNHEVRRLTPKQGKRMMGFPDDFEFPVNQTQAMKQLGNSVCVDVVYHVAKAVQNYLQQHTIQRTEEKDLMKFNKGEWSELYAFLKLMHDKKLSFGNARLQEKQPNEFIKIYALQHIGSSKFYVIGDDHLKIIEGNQTIDLGCIQHILNDEVLAQIKNTILNPETKTFNIEQQSLLELLKISSFKGSSYTKADLNISFEFQNQSYQYDPLGIKSFLGSAPTLLNAGSTTNFIYEVKSFRGTLQDVNQIETSSKIKDRLTKIEELGGQLEFYKCENDVFNDNLRKADSLMPEYLAETVLKYYKGQGRYLRDLVDDEIKTIRVKDFLKAILLGMFSGTPWDGAYTCNGLVVVRKDGDLLLYHVIKDMELKEYLFLNTKLDAASSTRHRFGTIYQETNGKYYFKLNLQIRNT